MLSLGERKFAHQGCLCRTQVKPWAPASTPSLDLPQQRLHCQLAASGRIWTQASGRALQFMQCQNAH